ncbi:MAG: glycoside hydrolase family 13 protein [Spirochaetales bacterium]|nr:glycoside hydrolase family 13 protein [Spirochaetales bacterium]
MKGNDWKKSAVIYQVMADRFFIGEGKTVYDKVREGLYGENAVPLDWDSLPEAGPQAPYQFFGGDFQGIIEKLDYIQNLGADTLYITPFFDSPSYHKYDALDFRSIDKAYGTFELYDKLREELKKRDMHLIIDLAINHLSDRHPLFVRALEDKYSEEAGMFRFFNHPDEYECWWGIKSMPEINYDDRGALDEFITGENSVLNFWMDKGADAIRFDCGNDLGMEVCQLIYRQMKERDPEVAVIGEVTNFAADWMKCYDGIQDYYYTKSLFSLLDGKITSRQFGMNMKKRYEAYGHEKAVSSFLMVSSHDFPRLRHSCKGDMTKYYQALTLQFTLPGIPMIYYGEEIGMDGGRDPMNRAPMIWDEKRWNREIYDFHRKMIAFRRTRPELEGGRFEDLSQWLDNGVVAFLRFGEAPEDYSVTLVNTTDKDMSFDLFVPSSHMYGEVRMCDYFGDGVAVSEDSCLSITMKAGQCSVYVPDNLYKPNYTYYKKRSLNL